MARFSAPTLFAVGLLAVAGVAGATFGVATYLDLGEDAADAGPDATTTTTPTESTATTQLVLAQDQVEVTGFLTSASLEGIPFGDLPLPITVTTPERGFGAGAVVSAVDIGGQVGTVTWDAGRPFALGAGGGGLRLGAVNVLLAPGAATIGFPDDGVHGFTPGTYTLTTPVGVQVDGGLLEARDLVTFTATEESAVSFRGQASTPIPVVERDLVGPGRVTLAGMLQVRQPGLSGPITATSVILEQGPFEISVTPVDGGWEVRALLQGAVQVT